MPCLIPASQRKTETAGFEAGKRQSGTPSTGPGMSNRKVREIFGDFQESGRSAGYRIRKAKRIKPENLNIEKNVTCGQLFWVGRFFMKLFVPDFHLIDEWTFRSIESRVRLIHGVPACLPAPFRSPRVQPPSSIIRSMQRRASRIVWSERQISSPPIPRTAIRTSGSVVIFILWQTHSLESR